MYCTLHIFTKRRGFNGSANIPEKSDFRSQIDPLNTIF